MTSSPDQRRVGLLGPDRAGHGGVLLAALPRVDADRVQPQADGEGQEAFLLAGAQGAQTGGAHQVEHPADSSVEHLDGSGVLDDCKGKAQRKRRRNSPRI